MKKWNETTRMFFAWLVLGAMIGIVFIVAGHYFIEFVVML